MKTAQPNPTHHEWVVEDQKEFLKWAYAFLQKKKEPTRIYTSPTGVSYPLSRNVQPIEVIHWLYKFGRDLQVLRLPFDDFKGTMLANLAPGHMDSWSTRKKYWGRWRLWVDNGYFRGPRSYVKATHHKPKELSEKEQASRDWRERKHFKLDRAKEGGWRRTKPKNKWVKKMCNRSYRRYEKLRIKNEDYEALENILPKDWFDPWIWD